MITFDNEEMQNRYNRIADKDIEKIFYEFMNKATKDQSLIILSGFSGEKGVALLKERANAKGYVLGMKMRLRQGFCVVDINTIDFVVEPSISIPRGYGYVDGKKQRKWDKMKNPVLSCRGVEMCLLGWSKFSGISCTKIHEELEAGNSLDELVFNKRMPKRKTVFCNGVEMPIFDALKESCIPRFEYVSKMRGVDPSDTQSVFEELAEKHREEAQRGVARRCGRIWIAVSDEDFGIVQSASARQSVTEQEALHSFISEQNAKGAK